jgi:elongation factor G
MAMAPWNGAEMFFMDTPGYTNFLADAKGVLKVMDAVLVLLSAVSGVKVETEKVWGYAAENDLPGIVFVNKMDRERADFFRTVDTIGSSLDITPLVVQLPIGKEDHFKGVFDLLTMQAYEYKSDGSGDFTVSADIPADLKDQVETFREKLVETAVETDDQLLERYLEGGEISEKELKEAISKGTLTRKFVPVYCGASPKNMGVKQVMDGMVAFLPSPVESAEEKPITGTNPKTEEEVTRQASLDAPFSAQVFKTIVDPFTGKLSLFRVYSGVLVWAVLFE